MLRKFMMLFIVFAFSSAFVAAQNVGIKTNALYWATSTPNLGVEFPMGKKHTAQVFAGLNPWKQSGGDQSSIRHWLIMPEYRYWFCQNFNGWFLGVHAMGGQFNAGGVKLPLGIFKPLRDHRYEGWYVGGGVSAGYQWPLSKHWNLETSLGVGYDYIQYDKFKCGTCGEKQKSSHDNYVGPTKAALSLIYML